MRFFDVDVCLGEHLFRIEIALVAIFKHDIPNRFFPLTAAPLCQAVEESMGPVLSVGSLLGRQAMWMGLAVGAMSTIVSVIARALSSFVL